MENYAFNCKYCKCHVCYYLDDDLTMCAECNKSQ